MKPYKLHIFVCQGKNCSAKGSERLLEVLRDRLEAEGLAGDIKTSKSGCLSVCKETDPKGGLCPAMVIYPEGVWYHKLAEDDMADIVEMHIKHGRLVERLLHHRMQIS
ncbi:MAG: (2Fe-2S) ferredoxin domain-containing protein [Deltaproteobacteria bacterium]